MKIESIDNTTDFYSHAPCGARPYLKNGCVTAMAFLLTRPMRGATQITPDQAAAYENFYSHAPCGARPGRGKIKEK